MHQCVGLHALFHRGGVDVGLESRARLTLGLNRAVELTAVFRVVIIFAADHGEYSTCPRIDAHQRGLQFSAAQTPQTIAHRFFGGFLHSRVESCVDAIAAFGQHRVGDVVVFSDVLLDIRHEIRRFPLVFVAALADETRTRSGNFVFDRGVALGLNVLRVIDFLVLQHFLEHDFLTLFGAIKVLERIQSRRRLRQTRQQRGFSNSQTRRRLIEISARRSLAAIGLIAIRNLVEIHFQNLVFGETSLQLQREQGGLQAARSRALVVEIDVFRQLLGDCRAALLGFSSAEVGQRRTDDALGVHARMGVETRVFNRQSRID